MPATPNWVQALRYKLEGAARSCPLKVSDRQELGARHSGRLSLRAGRLPKGSRLYVYACSTCRGWHLTRSPNNRAAVTADHLWEGVH